MPLEAQIASIPFDSIRRGVIWSMPFALTIGAADFVFGNYFLGAVNLLTVLGLCLYLWLDTRHYYQGMLHNFIVFLAAFLFLCSLLDGGIAGAGFIWSIGFPTVACFIAGSRAGLYWSIAYVPVVACALLLAQGTDFMSYEVDALVYGLFAYCVFSGFAYVMAEARENRELLLLQTKGKLQRHIDQLAESEANHSAVLATLPNAIGVYCDKKWVYANPAAVQLFGADSVDDIIGDEAMNYVHPDYRIMVTERMNRMSLGEHVPSVEEKLLRKNGEVFDAEVQGCPVIFQGKQAFLVICRDSTADKKREHELAELRLQLEHAQRLESLGVLAGGIAHDFNNLLAAIMGNAELAALEIDADTKAAKFLRNVDEACDRASILCRQMLAYAGKGEFTMKPIELGAYLKGMEALLHATIGKKAIVDVEIEEGMPPVLVDPAQFQQVILNLIVNASDAIGDQEGEILIHVEQAQLKKRSLLRYHHGRAMEEGTYAPIRVKDNGCGMDEETQARIFDPFFSTKNTGHGLGLSAIMGIIQRHKGGLRVRSARGQGCEFEILIPLADQKYMSREVQTSETIHMQGHGTVLVVDDEETIRSLAGNMLGKLGFEVLYAEDGIMGVEMFRSHYGELVAVLLDMTMPRLGGIDTLQRMREIKPGIPIVLVSGFSEVEIHELSTDKHPDAFVQKPFRLNVLKKTLYQVIEKHK